MVQILPNEIKFGTRKYSFYLLLLTLDGFQKGVLWDRHYPGDQRFPNFSDVTTTLNKHVNDQFASGHPLLDSRVTDQVASEAVFWTKTGVERALGGDVGCLIL